MGGKTTWQGQNGTYFKKVAAMAIGDWGTIIKIENMKQFILVGSGTWFDGFHRDLTHLICTKDVYERGGPESRHLRNYELGLSILTQV
jgi:hypothetical protein